MLCTLVTRSSQAPFGHSPAVHEGHQAKSSRLSDPAQQMLSSQQWTASVVAPYWYKIKCDSWVPHVSVTNEQWKMTHNIVVIEF